MARTHASAGWVAHWLFDAVFVWCALQSDVYGAEFPDLVGEYPPAAQEELLAEFEVNVKQLREFYGNITMVARRRVAPLKSLEGNPDANGERVDELTYRSRHERYFRMDVTPGDGAAAPGSVSTRVWLIRPEGCLFVRRDAPSKAFVIRDWSTDYGQGKLDFAAHHFQWAPYYNYVVPIDAYLLRRDGFATKHTVEIVPTTEKNERLAVARVNIVYRTGSHVTGEFVFYRDRAWAVKETKWGPARAGSRVRRCRCEYENELDGIPLLKRLRIWSEGGSEATGDVEAYVVVAIQPGAVPEYEFTPEAFGLQLGVQRATWMRKLLALCCLILLLTIYIALWRHRRKGGPTNVGTDPE